MDINSTVGLLALFAGLTVFFILYALYAPVVDRKPSNEQLNEGLFDEDTSTGIDPNDSLGKYVRPVLNNFLPQLPNIPMSEERKKSLNNLIIRSGNPWKITPEEFIGLQIVMSVLGLIISVIVVATGTLPEQVPPLVLVIFMTLAGFFVPFSKYNSQKEARTKAIQKELPEALDLLTITIATGQAFEFALESVTRQLPEGLLKTEFSKIIVELQAGSTLERSFTDLTRRFESEDLESFTKAVIQATKLGSDVTETLTQQANFVRSNYEARLQRMIARLETTMFIPLIGTMLPAFMIILIAPTMSQLAGFL